MRTPKTVRDLVALYQQHARGRLKPESFERRAWWMRKIVERMGDLRLEDCKAHLLDEWLKDNPTWGPHSQKRAIEAMNVVWNWALKLELVDRNPFRWVDKPKGAELCRRQPISGDDFRAVLKARNAGLRRVLIFLRFTGMRPCEVRALQWENVDFERRVILLWEHKTVERTGRPRLIPMGEVAYRLLLWIQKRRCGDQPYVFVNGHGEPWTHSGMERVLKRWRERTGASMTATLYCIRHAFATDALRRGVSVYDVSLLLGHTSIQMTQRYVHLADDLLHLRGAMNKATTRKGGAL